MAGLPLAESREDPIATFAACALKAALWPLRAVIAGRTALFLSALLAMLFWHPDVPFHEVNRWTFGLLVLAVFCAVLVGKKSLFAMDRASWPMICLTAVILISLIGHTLDGDTWGILGAKYLVPFLMFHIAKTVFAEERQFRQFEVLVFVVLAYLSFNSIAFLAGARALVFPQFILDPGLGYHSERARGPFLQPVANGVSLNLLGLLIWHAYRRGTVTGAKTIALLASVPLAILATLTRAVWLSFAGSVIAILFRSKNHRLRLAFVAVILVVVAVLGVVVGATSLGSVLSDRLEESSPVDYRMAVYAGGWQMFLEHPLSGWGFHQMPAELPRYVSEFHDKVLYPHNTYLEVLVENGLVGFAFYAWLMWELWRLGKSRVPDDERDGFLSINLHRLWPILLIVYWVNAAVVVMSYQFVNALLFSLAGMLAGQRQRAKASQC